MMLNLNMVFGDLILVMMEFFIVLIFYFEEILINMDGMG